MKQAVFRTCFSSRMLLLGFGRTSDKGRTDQTLSHDSEPALISVNNSRYVLALWAILMSWKSRSG